MFTLPSLVPPTLTTRKGAFALAIFSVTAAATILWLSRGTYFWHDDCDFLNYRSLANPLTLFEPHNDHAVVLPATAFRVIVDLAGTEDYLPFLVLLQCLHVATAAGIYALLASRSVWLALGAATLFLFLGFGADNFFWAFQITFVGSTATGIWAMWAAERRRWGLAAGLITASVFCSLVGVAFAASLVVLAVRQDRRRAAIWLLIPAGSLAAWWALFGLGWTRPPNWAVTEFGSPASLDSWLLVPGFIARAVLATVGGLTALGVSGGLFALTLAGAGLAVALGRGWRPPYIVLASLAGLLVYLIMTGVVRGPNPAGFASRHLYVAAVFMLAALPAIPTRRPFHAVWVAILVVAMIGNVWALVALAGYWRDSVDSNLVCLPAGLDPDVKGVATKKLESSGGTTLDLDEGSSSRVRAIQYFLHAPARDAQPETSHAVASAPNAATSNETTTRVRA